MAIQPSACCHLLTLLNWRRQERNLICKEAQLSRRPIHHLKHPSPNLLKVSDNLKKNRICGFPFGPSIRISVFGERPKAWPMW